MIELRQFRQFVAVAEELSFRRAAARLNMAQPPLTAAIRKIEEELGVVLIERGRRVEGLTPAGRAFLEEARRAVAQAERATLVARRAGDGLAGSLRVSFVASAANGLLPGILRHFRATRPDIELRLEEATTAQQIAALREDRTDIGFVVLPIADSSGLTVRLVHKDDLVAALPDTHPLVRRARVSLSDLREETWIMFPSRFGPGLYGRIMMACAAAGFAPRVAQEAVQMETAVGLVAGGLGVALVPPALALAQRPGVVFRSISGKGAPVAYDLALAFARRSPALDAFVAAALSSAGRDEGRRRAASQSHRR